MIEPESVAKENLAKIFSRGGHTVRAGWFFIVFGIVSLCLIDRGKKFIFSVLHHCKYLQMLKLVKSLPVVLFLALLHLQLFAEGNARHYFVGNSEEKISKTSSENLNFEPGYHECYIMVQETRKIGGQCVKIRENFQGCVAGSLMDPFHQDCL